MTWPLKSETAKCQVTIKGERYNMPHTIKRDMNRLRVSFLSAWKVKNHLIYVPRCLNRNTCNKYLKILPLYPQSDATDTHTHTGPFRWMVKCHYSWQCEWAEGQPVIFWRVLTLKCMMGVNRLHIAISPSLQTDGRLGNTTDCYSMFSYLGRIKKLFCICDLYERNK